MDDAAERSLLLWVQSFDDKVAADGDTVSTLEDLSDGVFLSHIMHHIDPEYVNLELVNEKAAGNWALKASNLKTLLRAIELFYHDELGQLCEAQELIDATLIAKHEDPKEISRLVELLLGCAVQCPSKSEYIHPIMQMDASEQASMMHTIENLMHRFQLASPGHHHGQGSHGGHSRNSLGYLTHEGESAENLHIYLTQALEKSSQLELKFLDMEREKRELTERLENALVEKQTLATKHTLLESERDKLVSERQSTLTRDNKKIQQIVEGEIHALTVQLEEKQDELARVKRESSERMMMLEHEVRRQADELDISRSKIAQLGKLEASVAKYKKKIEEMNGLRTQVKDLESHNAQYLDKVLDLESTVKTIPAMKTLVEKYKNQVVELETANVEASSSNQIKEQKIRRLQDELDSAMGGKEFLENQVDELRSQLASLQHHHGHDEDDEEQEGEDHEHGDGEGGRGAGRALRHDRSSSSSSFDSSSNGHQGGAGAGGRYSSAADFVAGNDSIATLRERMARLERENADLKRSESSATGTSSGSGRKNMEQSNELDMALKAKESLQGSVHELKRQNDQLFDELEALRQQLTEMEAAAPTPPRESESASSLAAAAAGGASRTGSFSTRASLSSSSPGKPENDERLAKLQADAEAVDSMRVTVSELTNRLKEKESVINELSEQRAKLENYTKKTLHAVQTKYMVAVSSHRNQINEKQERIDFMEKKMKETRASYSREQALMMSGFFEIGTEMQRRTMMPQAPGQGAQPAAWLASKRTEERAKRRQL